EVGVVEGGARDKTVALAREFTDRVVFRAWDGYGGQKNFALGQCHGDWVLSLDADERVTDVLREEIQRVLRGERSAIGFYLPRRNLFQGGGVRHRGPAPHLPLP